MISECVTMSSITADMTFGKDLTLQGCTKFEKTYTRWVYDLFPTSTVRLLACTLVLIRGGWQSGRGYNLYLSGASPKGHWCAEVPVGSARSRTVATSYTHHPRSSFSIVTDTQMESFKLKDPWRHPH